MNNQRISPLIFAVALLGAFPIGPVPESASFAQAPVLGGIDELAGKDQLSDSDRVRIGTWVNQHAPGLSGTPEQVTTARAALLGPFTRASTARISVQFRVEVGNSLLRVIGPLTRDSREVVAVNTLRLAGELATTNSLQLALDALGDQRPAVRYAACFAVGRTLDAVSRYDPAVLPGQLDGALNRLSEVASRDADHSVVDGAIVALSSGVGISNTRVKDQFVGVRSRAVIALTRAGGELSRRLTGGEDDVVTAQLLLRIATVIKDSLGERDRTGRIDLTQDALKAIGGFAGDLAAGCRRAYADNAPSRHVLERAAAAAQTSLSLAGVELTGRAEEFQLAAAIRDGNADRLQNEVRRIVDRLTAPPFGFQADRFN